MSTISRLSAIALGVALGLGGFAGFAVHPTEAHAATAAASVNSASTVGGQIYRSEVLARAQFWVDQHVVYGTTYDSNGNVTGTRSAADPEGRSYRTDCSGLVSMAWHLSYSPTTSDFVSLPNTTTIGVNDLQPGDALLWSGHIELFDGWKTTNHADGAWTYSLNGPADADWAKGPAANWKGQRGDASWGDITGTVRLIHYNNILADPSIVTGGTSADFTGDGKADIVARYPDGTLQLYPGTGTATQDAVVGAPIQIGVGWGPITALTAGDFTNDGKADLVARMSDGTLQLYPGTGSGVTNAVVSAPIQIGVGWGTLTAITAGDFNHDGKDDIVARAADGTLLLYPGTGNAVTNAVVGNPVRIGIGWGAMTTITAGDFNHDGKDDIVARAADGSAVLYPGTGNATQDAVVSAPVRIGVGWNTMTALFAGDFTNDGRSDLVGRLPDGTLTLYPGTGTATQDAIVSTPVRVGLGWQTITALS